MTFSLFLHSGKHGTYSTCINYCIDSVRSCGDLEIAIYVKSDSQRLMDPTSKCQSPKQIHAYAEIEEMRCLSW